jgi:Flp pilus assembly pilin Flp
MSDLITTAQDSFRDQCIDAYVVAKSVLHTMGERARDARGQTAAEYMGVLLVVSVIIAAVAGSGVGSDILNRISALVTDIGKGTDGSK